MWCYWGNMDTANVLLRLFPLLAILINWLISLYRASKSPDYFCDDLKQLWPDSIPYLRTQWPFVLCCLIGSCFTQASMVSDLKSKPEFVMTVVIASVVSAGILPILKLFYVSYLAAPKYPGRLATIGIWSVAVYVMSDSLLSAISHIFLFILAVPGLIVLTRTCLFLPIYALEGNQPLCALRRSWALTEDKYWMVSRYMGLSTVLFVFLLTTPQLLGAASLSGIPVASVYAYISSAASLASLVLSLIIAGLTYKLYDRLSQAEQQAQSTEQTGAQ
ncbi:hypothetical protein BH11CYA1_BH11CYA1_02530 [soil metagenome]